MRRALFALVLLGACARSPVEPWRCKKFALTNARGDTLALYWDAAPLGVRCVP